MSFPLKKWRRSSPSLDAVDALCRYHGVSAAFGAVLVNRGIGDAESADEFLRPKLSRLSDPFVLTDMRRAADRLWRAIENREPISVYGDYDVDGLTASAVLADVLGALGGVVQCFMPKRLSDGYGVTVHALERCLNTQSPQLVVTVDCGVTATDALSVATSRGVDVIVTDHHEPQNEIPAVTAVVDPKRDAPGPWTPLAGVGVAFKLCHALLKMGRSQGVKTAETVDLRRWLGLVAVGTVADVVPLKGENRLLVHAGLKGLRHFPHAGLMALASQAGVSGAINARHLGFMLGPRLNAPGRLGDATQALALLRSTSLDEARPLAVTLDTCNTQRRSIEKEILSYVADSLDQTHEPEIDFAIVASGERWHPGVIGIVASRLVECYRRPAVVVAFDDHGVGRGSARSIDGFNLVEALRRCDEHLDRVGGHKMAAGLTVKRGGFEAFRDQFAQYCAEQLRGRDLREALVVDAWLNPEQINESLVEEIKRLSPMGAGNRPPVWGVRGVTVVGTPRCVGHDKSHLKLVFDLNGVPMDAIGFGLGIHEVPPGPLDAVFELEENEFRGSVSLQMKLVDLCKHGDVT